MKIHLQDSEETRHLIRSHTSDTIVVGETSYSNSLAISAAKLIPDWTMATGDALASSDIELLVELNPELVLIGTGANQYFPGPEVLEPLITQRIGYEIMTTAAACRTYNVLTGEGRVVVAGLVLPA